MRGIISIFLCMASAQVAIMGSCPDGWTYSSGACYTLPKIQTENSGEESLKLNWMAAEGYCQSLGGHLASMNSLMENTVVSVLCGNGHEISEETSDLKCWIGLNDIREEGKFEWSDQTPFNYTNWAYEHSLSGLQGGPDNRGGLPTFCEEEGHENDSRCSADCVYVSAHDATMGDWFCQNEMPFVCRQPFDEYEGSMFFRLSLPVVSDEAQLIIKELAIYTNEDCKGTPIDLANKAAFMEPGRDTRTFAPGNQTSSRSVSLRQRNPANVRTTANPRELPVDSTPAQQLHADGEAAPDWSRMLDGDPSTQVKITCRPGISCSPTVYIIFGEMTEPKCIKIQTDGVDEVVLFSRRTFNGWQSVPLYIRDSSLQTARIARLPGYERVRALVRQSFDLGIPVSSFIPSEIVKSSDKSQISHFTKDVRVKVVPSSIRRTCQHAATPYAFGLSARLSENNMLALTSPSEANSANQLASPPRVSRETSKPPSISQRPHSKYEYIDKGFADAEGKLTFMEWRDITVVEPGQYRVCVCLGACAYADAWSVVSDLFVEGVSGLRTPDRSVPSATLFTYQVVGFGLTPRTTAVSESRIKIIPEAERCDDLTQNHISNKAWNLTCSGPNSCSTEPKESTRTLQTWEDVAVLVGEPETFKVCHCHKNCNHASPPWRFASLLHVGVPVTCPEDVSCHNGGSCIRVSSGKVECSCRLGYAGESCVIRRAVTVVANGSLQMMDSEAISSAWDAKQNEFRKKLMLSPPPNAPENFAIPSITGPDTSDRVDTIYQSSSIQDEHVSSNTDNTNSGSSSSSELSGPSIRSSTSSTTLPVSGGGDPPNTSSNGTTNGQLDSLSTTFISAPSPIAVLSFSSDFDKAVEQAGGIVALHSLFERECRNILGVEFGRCAVSVRKGSIVAEFGLRRRENESKKVFEEQKGNAKMALESNSVWTLSGINEATPAIVLPTPKPLDVKQEAKAFLQENPSREKKRNARPALLWSIVGVSILAAAFGGLGYYGYLWYKKKQIEREENEIEMAAGNARRRMHQHRSKDEPEYTPTKTMKADLLGDADDEQESEKTYVTKPKAFGRQVVKDDTSGGMEYPLTDEVEQIPSASSTSNAPDRLKSPGLI